MAALLAYALSPIDLIPDFVPVLGYLDDLVLLPLGIWVAVRMVPHEVWLECRERATAEATELPVSRGGAAIVVTLWVLLAGGVGYWILTAG